MDYAVEEGILPMLRGPLAWRDARQASRGEGLSQGNTRDDAGVARGGGRPPYPLPKSSFQFGEGAGKSVFPALGGGECGKQGLLALLIFASEEMWEGGTQASPRNAASKQDKEGPGGLCRDRQSRGRCDSASPGLTWLRLWEVQRRWQRKAQARNHNSRPSPVGGGCQRSCWWCWKKKKREGGC